MGILDALPTIINGATASITKSMTIERTGGGTYNPDTGAITGASVTEYTCKGIVEEWSRHATGNNLVPRNSVRVLIMAASLSITPRAGDVVIDSDASRYRIGDDGDAVRRDPATAVWEIAALRE